MTEQNNHRTEKEIVTEMQSEGRRRDEWNRQQNEGASDGYNPHEDNLSKLSDELREVRAANSPLNLDLPGERAAFLSQKFTGKDLQKANAWCLDRGYSLADLQAAAKAAK